MVQAAFRKYLEEAMGPDNVQRALDGLSREASVSLRINPFKNVSGGEPFGDVSSPVPWSAWGRLLPSRPSFTLDPLFHCGAYYVQDSSAMFVGEVFRKALESLERPLGRPLRVLDLCAAPGGKTTDLSASLRESCGDDFLLVANEVMRNRASVLSANAAVWGDPCTAVSSLDPSAFRQLPGFFDVIVADVPCSGEGMFRKDEEAVAQWSESNVELCASRQRRIVADVWPALRRGGVFIYSTCTFNRYENDGNAQWICREMGAEPLTGRTLQKTCPEGGLSGGIAAYEGLIATEYGFSLVPGFVPGEGQYCAAMVKTSCVAEDMSAGRSRQESKSRRAPENRKGAESRSAASRVTGLFEVPVGLRSKGDLVTVLPSGLEASVSAFESRLPLISAGCAVGRFKGDDLVPDGDLAYSIALRRDAFNTAAVDRQTALAFLHKDNIVLPDAPKGLLLLLYEGVGLGFVKNLGSRCNSLLPQSRRIRMEIKTPPVCQADVY